MANYSDFILVSVAPAHSSLEVSASGIHGERVSLRSMKILRFVLSALVLSFFLCNLTFGQTDSATTSAPPTNPQIMSLSDIHPGLRGVAYTVFQGTQPEPMDVEILGVLANLNGP